MRSQTHRIHVVQIVGVPKLFCEVQIVSFPANVS